MIRRSMAVGAAAILMSVLVHSVGLSVTTRPLPPPDPGVAPEDVVALGNAFEDIAGPAPEPVEPEDAESPTPEEATAPEPETAEVPTSEALVASPDPQDVEVPNTGTAEAIAPDVTEPVESAAPQGEAGDQIEAATVTPPVETEPGAEMPDGDPDAPAEPLETAALAPVAPAPTPAPAVTAPTPQVSDSVAQLPVTVAPVPTSVPVVPLSETSLAPVPEISEVTEVEGSELAVATSLRPLARVERPQTARGLPEATASNPLGIDLSQAIESPLARYRRDGVDLLSSGGGAVRSNGLGFLASRSGGNASTSNYAGQVLVHLNRAPKIDTSARGDAQVFLEIDPDGSLGSVGVIDSRGSPDIHRAAMAQVRRAAPFPRPPAGASRRLVFFYRSDG